MNYKLIISFCFVFVLLLSIGISTKAEGENYSVYLSIIKHPKGFWEEVGPGSASNGGISNNDGPSFAPSLAFAPDGTAYATWYDESSGNWEIYVRAWDGNHWTEVGTGSASNGGISKNTGDSFKPSIAVAPDGTPYITWHDNSNGYDEIYIRAWNGNGWVEVGPGSASEGGISNNNGLAAEWLMSPPSIAIAPNGIIYIAWSTNVIGNDEIYVRAWNGSNWEEVGSGSGSGGGISNTTGGSYDPSLALAPDGAPYVAWYDESSGISEIYIRAWNGSSWVEVGAGSAEGGGISQSPGRSQGPSLAIAQDNTLYIAWYDNSLVSWAIYVKAWDGSSWMEVGTGSASGVGIGEGLAPSLAIGPDGRVYVAWDYGGYIYILEWDGNNWEEIAEGEGSAHGHGIGRGSEPSVKISQDNTPMVTCSHFPIDLSFGYSDIYVRWYIFESENNSYSNYD